MAGQTDEGVHKAYAPGFGRPLDEARTPKAVGEEGGMTACSNVTYRRAGSWGKRSGSAPAYSAGLLTGAQSGVPYSGVRWYRNLPSPLTQLVVGAQTSLFAGNDPVTTPPYSPLTKVTDFASVRNTPLSFASAFDPWSNAGAGADVLIICGTTGPYGFGRGSIAISGTITAGQNLTITVNNGSNITTSTYTTLPTDNAATIAAALANLVNQTAAVAPGTPFLSQATSSASAIQLYALNSGSAGNSITYFGTSSGSIVLTPSSATNFAFGGTTESAPVIYTGSAVTGLSGQFRGLAFTGCVAWHDHVWYWGDPNHPYSVYASDINTPEGLTFMANNGAYDIGEGDGDPRVVACVPIGNSLYVFKTNNIYVIQGYDFQTGEYEFSVTPVITGHGIQTPQCVAVLRNALVFWDGTEFQRLANGSYEVEPIGLTIPITSGRVAQGDPRLMRAVAGSFIVQSNLTNIYTNFGPGVPVNEVMTNVAIFACDIGNGVADTMIVYDDDASRVFDQYAWSVWTGLTIEAFIPFQQGYNQKQNAPDQQYLYFIPQPPQGTTPISVSQFGATYASDTVAGATPEPISWKAQTGFITMETPALVKDLQDVYLEVEATANVMLGMNVLASGPVNGLAATLYPITALSVPPTVAPANSEAFQTLQVDVTSRVRGYSWMFTFSESTIGSSFELDGMTLYYLEFAFLE